MMNSVKSIKMSGERYLLDTNIVVAFLNEEPAVIARVSAEDVAVPIIVIGELAFGAVNSSKPQENLNKVKGFREDTPIYYCDLETTDHFAAIKLQLKQKGRPIPMNDLWIAAIAMQHDMVVVTRDQHFDHIDGLKVERW